MEEEARRTTKTGNTKKRYSRRAVNDFGRKGVLERNKTKKTEKFAVSKKHVERLVPVLFNFLSAACFPGLFVVINRKQTDKTYIRKRAHAGLR